MRISREELIAVWGSLMGGFIVAHLAVGRFSVWFVVCLLAIAAILYVLWHIAIWGMLAIGRRELDDYAQCFGEINRLSLEDAKSQAEKALRDTDVFACIDADREPPDIVSKLGGCTSEVLRRYKEIKMLGQETLLGWDQIGVSEYRTGFIRIGMDMEWTEYAVRPGTDDIFELDSPSKRTENADEPLHPTIYHLIVSLYEAEMSRDQP